jgi:hypothetical protein
MDTMVVSSAATITIDWDETAGEAWGRLILEDNVIALVSSRYPVMFLVDEIEWDLSKVTEGLVAIEVPALDVPVLRAGLDRLLEMFDEKERFHLLNPDGFSVNDLWYATV